MDRRHTKSSLLTDYDINAPVLHLPQKKKKLSSKCEALFLVRDLMFSCPLPKKIAHQLVSCISQHPMLLTHKTDGIEDSRVAQDAHPLRPQEGFRPWFFLGEEDCCVTGGAQTQQTLFF